MRPILGGLHANAIFGGAAKPSSRDYICTGMGRFCLDPRPHRQRRCPIAARPARTAHQNIVDFEHGDVFGNEFRSRCGTGWIPPFLQPLSTSNGRLTRVPDSRLVAQSYLLMDWTGDFPRVLKLGVRIQNRDVDTSARRTRGPARRVSAKLIPMSP